MSAEQAAADDTSRAPDCVVEFAMDGFGWIGRALFDTHRLAVLGDSTTTLALQLDGDIGARAVGSS